MQLLFLLALISVELSFCSNNDCEQLLCPQKTSTLQPNQVSTYQIPASSSLPGGLSFANHARAPLRVQGSPDGTVNVEIIGESRDQTKVLFVNVFFFDLSNVIIR